MLFIILLHCMTSREKLINNRSLANKLFKEKWYSYEQLANYFWKPYRTVRWWINENSKSQQTFIREEEIDECEYLEPWEWDKDNVLVIGDIHEPRCKEWYYEFVRSQQEYFNCWTVIFIWDIVDFQAASFHDSNPDLPWAWDELDMSIEALQKWFYTFPEAIVTVWNHDLIPKRKWFSLWLSNRCIKWLNEIIWAPDTWNFVTEIIIDDVLYTHWTQWDAFKKAVHWRISTVQWHIHTKAFVQYQAWRYDNIFWMQVWCGIDRDSEAFNYAKSNSDLAMIACGVILDSGKIPLVVTM